MAVVGSLYKSQLLRRPIRRKKTHLVPVSFDEEDIDKHSNQNKRLLDHSRVIQDNFPLGPAGQLNIEISAIKEHRFARCTLAPFALGKIPHCRVLTGDIKGNLSAVVQICSDWREDTKSGSSYSSKRSPRRLYLQSPYSMRSYSGTKQSSVVFTVTRMSAQFVLTLASNETYTTDSYLRPIGPYSSIFSVYHRLCASHCDILSPAGEHHWVAAPGNVHIGAEIKWAGLALRGVLDGSIDRRLLSIRDRHIICHRAAESKRWQG